MKIYLPHTDITDLMQGLFVTAVLTYLTISYGADALAGVRYLGTVVGEAFTTASSWVHYLLQHTFAVGARNPRQ